MANAVFAEWLNANTLRSYPIYENCTKVDRSGTFEIPNDFLASAQINFSREDTSGEFYISSIENYGDTISVYISHSAEQKEVASVKMDYGTHSINKVYPFAGSGEFSHIVGYLCASTLESMHESPKGRFEFLATAATFETNCLFVSVPMLKRVEIYSGDTIIHSEANVLRLKAGENIRLSYEEADAEYGGSTGIIRIDAISGVNLQEPDRCNNAPTGKDICIRTINGIGPDDMGNFNVYGDECLEVIDLPDQNAIKVVDKCSQSCCGCTELDTLVEALETLKTKEENMKNMVDSLRTQQTEMITKLSQEII